MRRKSTLSKKEKEKSEQEKNRFKIIKKRENHYKAKQRKKMTDFVDGLTDAELRTKLAEYGFPVLPITTTTRKVMSKKLKMLIENKNKANSDGRRSLAKYSSEEESDDDSKKKNTNRRQTIAAVMLPPANKTRRSIRKNDTTLNDDLQDTPTVNTTTTTEVKTRRTTRIIKPVIEADLEEGSDSEPDPIESYLNSREIRPSPPRPSPPKMSYPISEPSTSSTLNRPYVSGRSPLGQSPDYGSPSRFATTTDIADSSFDKINQIRSRLSHSTNYEKPTFGSTVDKRATIGGYGDGDASSIIPPASTPYLSNFSKRLSQLSNSATAKPTDYSYKNDIIKEHDANGSSYSRSYLSRPRIRDYPQEFKTNQENKLLKNNLVSYALIAVVITFFFGIAIMYFGMRNESPAIQDTSDYVIPLCLKGESWKPTINCVVQSEIQNALNLYKVLTGELSKRALTYHCKDSNLKPYMMVSDIVDFVSTHYALKDPYEIQKGINNLQVLIFKNPKWGLSVINPENYPSDSTALDDTMEKILSNRHEIKLALIAVSPELPWKCIIINKLYTILSSLFVVAVGFFTIFGGQKGYKYLLNQKKLKNDKIYSMVEKIIDILQNNAAENTDNFLAVNHVRDMLIPPQDRTSMISIWNSAVKFLQENESRVRTEVQIVAGEEFHVWRWLGSANLNLSSSPRSKSWQGQAFETQAGINSLPCSPTPCLKIRGMFEERDHNLYTVREAVLSKCANMCNILHCEADTSGCVYLKCANEAEAAIAYRNLHGWWYDGSLVTVKYLRLERYMQRFPDSPTKGPPYLVATENTKDWSNNDN